MADLPVEPGFELCCCDGVVDVGVRVVWLPVLVLVVGVLEVVGVLVVGVEVEVVGGGALVLVGGGVVVAGGGQLSPTITAPAGNEIDDNETPSGTGNVKSCAPNSRTVTVHD